MSSVSPGIEGRLDIYLTPGSSNSPVRIESSRPVLAARVFEGKSVAQTLDVMPLLFNICGHAQTIAAVRAIESARGTPAAPTVESGRELLLRLETLREHLWRVLLDWPWFCGAEREQALLAQLMRQIQALKTAVNPQRALLHRPGLQQSGASQTKLGAEIDGLRSTLARGVFARDSEQWIAFDSQALFSWMQTSDTAAARMLRFVHERGWSGLGPSDTTALTRLPEPELLTRLDADDAESFIARPHWQREPRETGPAARQRSHGLIAQIRQMYGQGLMVRLLARLTEIAEIGLGLSSVDAPEPPSSAKGLSQIEAARGRLCHRVVLEGDRVQRYRVLAPTEWNFGPGGPAEQAFEDVTADDPDSARAQAQLLIHAIDPCVGYELSLVGVDG
jgi:coenzyme F420-reducing hydrogenase alpha subunit